MSHQAQPLEIQTELASIPGPQSKSPALRSAHGPSAAGCGAGPKRGNPFPPSGPRWIRHQPHRHAPVYGFGHSEEIVGKAVSEARLRSKVLIATKAGLEWHDGKVVRNASRARLMQEVDDSLRQAADRLHRYYQVHWPDLW